jgi:hypothetical protein
VGTVTVDVDHDDDDTTTPKAVPPTETDHTHGVTAVA